MQTELHNYNDTKIIATIGPASEDFETIQKLIRVGADCFRLNFSHGDGSYFQPVIDRIREAARQANTHIPILADIQGPKIRVGILPQDGVQLVEGSEFTITVRNDEVGSEKMVYTPYEHLTRDVSPGHRILLADGTIELLVKEVGEFDVKCSVVIGGTLFSNKGMNLPGARLSVATLTEKDIRDLKFIAQSDIDMIAVSFVRTVADIELARKITGNDRIPIIAKLELPEALDNLNEIIQRSDGVLIARGDLGVEMDFEMVPFLQKQILERSAVRGKWVVVATQMLLSMVRHNRPSRAEVSDVSNAVMDGADAVMLSEETAAGRYPVAAVEAMVRIARAAEKRSRDISPNIDSDIVSFSVGAAGAAVAAASRLKARAIVTLSGSGLTALHLSKWRPGRLIIALSSSESSLRRLNVLRGVIPVHVPRVSTMEKQIEIAECFLVERGYAKAGDAIVVVGALPAGRGEETNTIRFYKIKDGCSEKQSSD